MSVLGSGSAGDAYTDSRSGKYGIRGFHLQMCFLADFWQDAQREVYNPQEIVKIAHCFLKMKVV